MITKEEILDKLMTIETEIEEEYKVIVKQKVTAKIIEMYGEEGRKVCDIYYNDSSEETAQTDCPDCAKNAQDLIDKLQIAERIVDSLTESEITELLKVTSEDEHCIEAIEKCKVTFRNSISKQFGNLDKKRTVINLIIRTLLK